MRTKSSAASAVLANPAHSARAIVSVYSSGGVARVLNESALMGLVEPTLQVEVEHDIDSPRTARVTLRRQQGVYSLAPLATTGNPLFATYGEAVVDVGRRITIQCELLLPGITETPAGLSETIFDGFIDELQWPADELELVCTDRTALLRDKWIERERAYCLAQGVNATKGCYVWRSDLPALAVGDLVLPSSDRRNAHFYKVTAASSAQSTTEPTWPTGSGATVVSGGVTLQEAGATDGTTGLDVEDLIQLILNDNDLGALVALQVPAGSAGWMVKPYLQQRQTVLEALEALAAQLGWYLRFEWVSSLGRYELVLAEPARTSVTTQRVLTEDDEVDCSELGVDIWDIRNVVRVVYSDSSTKAPGGEALRKVVEVSDAASITKYGRRFCEIAESSSSSIDTSTEATRLANAVLADLKEPQVAVGVSFSVDPYLELGDRVQLPNDPQRWATAPVLAVRGLSHSFSESSARTTLRLLGAPSAGRGRWLDMEGRISPGDVHALTLNSSILTTIAAASSVGGQHVTVTTDRTRHALEAGMELHVSPTANFPPSSTTLVAETRGDSIEVGSLVPGKTYYAKTVPWSRNASRLVRGEPSEEFSFVAGRAKAGHYDSLATQSHLPLNGNFEHATEGITVAPPDHWRVENYPSESGESWGSSGSVYYGTDASKGRYIELRANGSTRGNIVSSPFEVRRGLRALTFYLSIMRTGASAVSGKDLLIDVLGYADAALSSLIVNWTVTLSGSASGPYPTLSTWYDTLIDFGSGYGAVPSNVNFIVLRIRRGTAGDASFAWRIGDIYAQEADFERLRVTNIEADLLTGALWTQQSWQAPTLGANWSNFGGGNMAAGYFKDALGVVHLRGLVTRSSGGAAVFQLPSGYRPSASIWFAQPNDVSSSHYIYITSAGDVHVGTFAAGAVAGTATIVLDGITFDTR